MIWAAAMDGESCGRCGTRLNVGDPLALFCGHLKRCQACSGCEPDWKAVDDARMRQEAGEAREKAPVAIGRAVDRSWRKLGELKPATRGELRRMGDPKMRASGE